MRQRSNRVLLGGAGDDVSNGGGGRDFMSGGRDDSQDGGAGSDKIFANQGRDVSTGGDGRDVPWRFSRKDVAAIGDLEGDELSGGEDTTASTSVKGSATPSTAAPASAIA